MHLTLSRSHSSPVPTPASASAERVAQPTLSPASSPRRTPSSPTPVARQEKGVKRIVSGLKRRISRTFHPGHRHHVDAQVAADDEHEDEHDVQALPIVVSADTHRPPITITLSGSPQFHASVDTLSRSVAAGGLGKHAADFSESDATSSSDDNSLFEGQRTSRRAASSGSGSFSYTSPDEQQILCEEDPFAHPLPLIEETESGALVPEPPAIPDSSSADGKRSLLSARFPPPESLTAPIEGLALTPNPDDSDRLSRERKISLASIESLTAPLETLVLCDDNSQLPLPPFERLTAPLETIVLQDITSAALTIPLPLSRPDSPALLAMETSTSVTPETRTETLDSELSAPMDQSEPLVSPPAPVGDPEVPDPFLREPDESEGDDALAPSDAPEGLSTTSPLPSTEEISLAPAGSITPDAPKSPNVNKSVPPTPVPAASDDDEEDEEDVPELYLPGLTLPTMFLPIPNTDPLSTLLTKYTPPEKRPPRDLTGDYSRAGGDLHTMIMTNSWRAIARQARDRIVEADPEDVPYILSLWYLRLSSLARMRLFNQTSAECTNLFAVLNAVEPREAREYLFDRILPFELEVIYARLKYWAGDHVGYLDALAALLRRCKAKARAARADQTAAGMWTERGARVCLIIASQLVEMRVSARAMLPPCVPSLTSGRTIRPPPNCSSRSACSLGGVSSPALRSAVARIYLQGGYIAMAAKHFAAVAEDPTADPVQKAMNAALFASAEGDWGRATAELQRILAADPENFVAVNNLAVALLNQGRLQEAIQVLESALQTSPATIVTAEPFLFNLLATLYELRSAAGADKKRELLIEVAKWAGDGLRTTCLKLPTT
ncbi:hypothetical protein BN946_scf184851.g24 [Trametes cinnabarina]|uniref:Uncharacterized protein n=1 Tax=Pycnoporus cinnabarinus TaxID=5643 RepID=A0A060S5Z2_PYCCI|nr:hypothetical protein BN946_scf184851.g24 [Trametes cinnabarina]